MDISVIICTYNRSTLLKRTLESFLTLDVPQGLSWEVLIVDNNSSDDTKSAVLEFLNMGRINIRYIFEPRQGKGFALNSGIKKAEGEILAFTDDDITVDKNWLRAVAEAPKRYPNASGFGGKIIINWPMPKPGWIIMDGPYRNIDGTIGHRDLGEDDGDFAELNSLPSGGNMFFRRMIFEEGHIFREDMRLAGKRMVYGEDTEFCLRLKKKGVKLFYISGAIVYHNIQKDKLNKRYFCKRRYDNAYFGVKYSQRPNDVASWFGVPRYLFRYLVTDFFKWLFSVTPSKRFFYKLKLCSVIGQITGYFKRKPLI